MKTHRNTIYFCFAILVVSIIIINTLALIDEFKYELLINILIGIFSSTLLVCATSGIAYSNCKKSLLVNLLDRINKLNIIEGDYQLSSIVKILTL